MTQLTRAANGTHPTRSFDLVIFDCDGVLVESEWLEGELLTESLRGEGIEITVDEAVCRFAGRQLADISSNIARELGIRLESEFWSRFLGRLEAALREKLKPVPGVIELLGNLELPFCVASNSPRDRLIVKLRAANLLPFIGTRFVSAQDVVYPKPAPHLFLFAAELMGTRPERCLVVEDSFSGLKAASAAGMQAVKFLGGRHCTPQYIAKLSGVPVFGTACNGAELLSILTSCNAA
ncbi:HAD family hydrolase [Mesorhizobium neociceri]|uniref:HAD family phosphatase n=1 Tax=Mesorhizobium neociceri TaxID=1307853 RepID=A0A838B7A5_9HYPH|nr:HAD family phosphatase [Mesorhizobium neociceri]MBA1142325.1 HAD family phosphatase [Mesorhizobium neociceri]